MKLYLYDAKTEDLGCLFYDIIAFVEEATSPSNHGVAHSLILRLA